MEFCLIGLLQMPTPSFGGYPGPIDGRALWQEIVELGMLISFGLCVLIPVLYIIFARRTDARD
jgi:hypothetical protein